MADAYFYSSAAQQMALSGSVNGSTTSFVVDTVTGLPASTPFKLVVDPGLGTEEIVKVTGVSGTTLTVVRGWDGTAGQSHANLAVVRHMVTAEDIRLARQHEAASTGVHGATGAVVGLTDTQVLTNKDLSSGTNTFPSSLATDNELSAAITAHAGSTTTHGVSGNIVGTAGVQTLTNKNLGSDTNTFPSTLATTAQLAAQGAATETLTNKTINGAANTLVVPQAQVTGLVTDLAALDTRLDTLEDVKVYHTTISITPSAANTPTSQAVALTGFASVDAVQVTPLTTVPGTTVTGWGASSITTGSVTIWVTRTNTTATGLMVSVFGTAV